MNNSNDEVQIEFKPPKLEILSEGSESPSPKRTKMDSLYKSEVNNNSSITWKEEEIIKDTNIVITVEQLKAFNCRGKMMSDIDVEKVDVFADQCFIKDLYHPFRSSLIRLIVPADSMLSAIVVKGNHRIAALSKQRLTSEEKNVKVFVNLTTISRRLFNSLWEHAGSLRYTEMGNSFNRQKMVDFVMEIYMASLSETSSRIEMKSLNNQAQHYMWKFDHLFSPDDREQMMLKWVEREAQFKKWFGSETSISKRQIQKDLLLIYCMPESSKKQILSLLEQGYENDFETAKQLKAERGKARKPAALLSAIRKCI